MSKAAMQQALDALEYHVEQTRPIERTNLAITALLEALEQPEPEPVAWACQFYKGKRLEVFSTEERASTYVKRSLENGADVRLISLYTHPAPPQKPLTIERLHSIPEHRKLLEKLGPVWAPMLYYFCSAIEAAHGITGKTK